MTLTLLDNDPTDHQQCVTCGEWWPAEPEFFHFFDGKPQPACKACYASKGKRPVLQKREALPPGITRIYRHRIK